ncbi:DNA polymerase III subunit gamma/tau [Rhabdobacter roseus]|uniref:DNA polymerase III subunit gamma/tau n=1 Tax=Rhabdobacter roseus TaxID=1655419 RepID=A0A840U3T2_9BACT|nr:DNA polymerase III subunit gamma/tau [Rhabdobacter roseus]MBB5286499.1 DNA polymerase-3 subunit gamma/tau [Rhabdobacter roseus]
MDHFVVSARKYRPITFDSVVGQSHITTTLKNAIRTNHLAQAFLFCGPRGVGKTTCARILAKTINCQNLSDDVEPCGQCESCVSFQNNASFNIHELDAASNNSVEDIRNLIDQVRYPPQTGKYKIYIIDEVHMLSQAAFNAFLKTLEEPPSYAIFILATTEKHKILPTILSRCQIFDFNRIQSVDIADHLARIADKENIKAEREALELIGQKADGGLRDALSMFDLNVTFSQDNFLSYQAVLENLHILDYDYYFKITDALLNGSVAQSLILFDEILRKGFDGHLFVVGLLEHFRNLLVCKDPATVTLLQVSESARQKYLAQSARAEMSFLLSALSVGSQCDIHYKAAKNQRLHVELCLMKLANLPHILNLGELAAVDETAKKKVDTSPPLTASTEPAAPAYEKPNGVPAPTPSPVATAAPTPPPPVVAGTAQSRLRSTVHLTAPVAAQVPTAPTEEASAIVPTLPDRPALPLTLHNLTEAWQEFAAECKRLRDSTTEEVTLNREIELEGTLIRLALDNDLQKETLQALKGTLLGFLRKRFNEPGLRLEERVAPQEVKRMPYTPSEKFNYMAEKNPHLRELQQALGLDVDF